MPPSHCKGDQMRHPKCFSNDFWPGYVTENRAEWFKPAVNTEGREEKCQLFCSCPARTLEELLSWQHWCTETSRLPEQELNQINPKDINLGGASSNSSQECMGSPGQLRLHALSLPFIKLCTESICLIWMQTCWMSKCTKWCSLKRQAGYRKKEDTVWVPKKIISELGTDILTGPCFQGQGFPVKLMGWSSWRWAFEMDAEGCSHRFNECLFCDRLWGHRH